MVVDECERVVDDVVDVVQVDEQQRLCPHALDGEIDLSDEHFGAPVHADEVCDSCVQIDRCRDAMNLVQITAGVDVGIQQVQLGIVGVLAEAYLYVDLDNVARIVGRVVQTLDRNPPILTQVLKTVETAATSLTRQTPAQTTQPARRP